MAVFEKEYSEAYDCLYQDKDYVKECDFIEALFSKSNGKIKTILDMGCGTGGHSSILTKRGYNVTGVDLSAKMLDIAREKAAAANLSIEYIQGDLTKIRIKQKYDAVISMFAVMSYQTANDALEAACETAMEHLNPGGIFIFDCWHGPAVLTDKPGVRVKEIKLSNKEKIIRFTDPLLDPIMHTVDTRFKLWRIKEGCVVSEVNESHLMRFIFPQEIRYYLKKAGFKRVEFRPFLEIAKTLTEKDWNMTVIASR